MWPDLVSNPGPLVLESDVLPAAHDVLVFFNCSRPSVAHTLKFRLPRLFRTRS